MVGGIYALQIFFEVYKNGLIGLTMDHCKPYKMLPKLISDIDIHLAGGF